MLSGSYLNSTVPAFDSYVLRICLERPAKADPCSAARAALPRPTPRLQWGDAIRDRGPDLPTAATAHVPEAGAGVGGGAAMVRWQRPLLPCTLRRNRCQASAWPREKRLKRPRWRVRGGGCGRLLVPESRTTTPAAIQAGGRGASAVRPSFLFLPGSQGCYRRPPHGGDRIAVANL